jgi:purine-nucleoside phosphorylase
MLRDLTKSDWLSMLAIPKERVPHVLLLRGTRNLKRQYQHHQRYFANVQEVGSPNGFIEDVFLADLGDLPIAYASVYGPSMASEIVHIFGVLGTRLAIQTGCCGILGDEMGPGDLFLPLEAFCGEGAAHYYKPDGLITRPSPHPAEFLAVQRITDVPVHQGRLYTTAALLAEGEREIEEWFSQGWSAVDMETATTFAVAEHFGMQRLAILFAFDNPRRRRHLLLSDEEEDRRRQQGNPRMIEVVLEVMREFGNSR